MTPQAPRPLVFLDTETTSLRHDRQVWEVAAIRHDEAGETEETYQAFLPVDLSSANPASLAIGRFYERHPYGRVLSRPKPDQPDLIAAERLITRQAALVAAGTVARLTHGATIVGAVPWFDTEVLAKLLRRNGILPGWHYHLVDVETFAAGALRMEPPWDFDTLLAEFGLTYDEEQRHTALGDARMVQRLYWAARPERAR